VAVNSWVPDGLKQEPCGVRIGHTLVHGAGEVDPPVRNLTMSWSELGLDSKIVLAAGSPYDNGPTAILAAGYLPAADQGC
jgi:hypothetical protein